MATKIPELARLQVKTRDDRRCVRCFCPTKNGAWHHRRSRRVVDAHQHCPCNGVWLCKTCHDWVHGHPLEARPQGWIVLKSVGLPATVRVFREQDGWCYLTCDGGVIAA